ncbi:aryl-alcohol oxidase-like protein [Dichomitus squalens LYAD-421 SS1]|uniref:Aryl-alcohol oxidase-like protein n=1 Tax=Dichomitus squalens (strain LYAD-421) TaxID=732165 RepID=R7T0M9_DICSQ|nr:aryl-alcohol oxidase-like protein [Dichomitus squalens LYAD-421 SS1]EJF61540.1 aryl-alcohol oxidase-like protein [Dichomitus squalens LYAD-421 SS1]
MDVYDFVIVGAGAGGNVIAARLTEDPRFSVLLIEAGISHEGVLPVEIPFLAPTSFPNTSVTWNYSTTPQEGLNQRVLPYPRGRVLGGSTSINFMAYTRGSNEEFDRWAAITKDDGWSWKNVEIYYLRNSKLVPRADNQSCAGLVNPADHGFGPVDVSLPGFPTEIDGRFVDASKSSGSQFPFSIDLNSGNALGFEGVVQNAIGRGARSSSATAYLEPALNRSNLHVLIENTVTKLISTGSVKGAPSFRKVQFAPNATAPYSLVTARKEVILSAVFPDVGTPQILLLSGIGDKDRLRALDIEPLLDLPDVGQHLKDHPILANYWNVSSNNTYDDLRRNTTLIEAAIAQWQTNRTGRLVDSPVQSLAFMRVPANSRIFDNVTDPSAGPHSGHFEFLFADGYGAVSVPQPPTGHFLTVFSAVVAPTSVGSIKLASSDPFDNPLIDPGFFSTEFDTLVMLEAIKTARQFMALPAWGGLVSGRFGPVGDAETDEEIIAAARVSVETIYHPVSTARMSPRDASWGVVDPNLLVKGASGLRVVDASVFPTIPAAHTMALVYIVAERAAELIKRTWD